VAATIDDEVKILIDKAYEHCRQLLADNSEAFQRVVDYLLEHESMTGKQFAACMAGETVADSSDTVLLDGFNEETDE
jgi:cell division protease FtsH